MLTWQERWETGKSKTVVENCCWAPNNQHNSFTNVQSVHICDFEENLTWPKIEWIWICSSSNMFPSNSLYSFWFCQMRPGSCEAGPSGRGGSPGCPCRGRALGCCSARAAASSRCAGHAGRTEHGSTQTIRLQGEYIACRIYVDHVASTYNVDQRLVTTLNLVYTWITYE